MSEDPDDPDDDEPVLPIVPLPDMINHNVGILATRPCDKCVRKAWHDYKANPAGVGFPLVDCRLQIANRLKCVRCIDDKKVCHERHVPDTQSPLNSLTRRRSSPSRPCSTSCLALTLSRRASLAGLRPTRSGTWARPTAGTKMGLKTKTRSR